MSGSLMLSSHRRQPQTPSAKSRCPATSSHSPLKCTCDKIHSLMPPPILFPVPAGAIPMVKSDWTLMTFFVPFL